MIKNKYDLMKDSIYTDENGVAFPDLATFPINTFASTKRAITGTLSEQSVYYFYNMILQFYNSFDMYDDILLWLNDIPYLEETYIEKNIKLFKKEEIDTWYLNNL